MSPLLDGPFLQDGVVLNYVAGVWERGGGDGQLLDLDPANEEEIAAYVPSTARDAAAALAAAAATQPDWAATSVYARAEVLRRVAGLIRERADALAATLTREEGKPLAEARGEVIRTAELLEV